MPEASVRPYRFKGLRKYTRESAALLAAFSRYLGVNNYGQRVLDDVAKTAAEMFRHDVAIYFDHLSTMTFDEMAVSVPENGCLVRVGMLPKQEKIVWELDPVVAAAIIERLLGGKGEELGLARPLTDIEHGVLLYGLLKLVSAFQTSFHQGSELAVRVESVEQTVEPLRTFFPDDLTLHVISVKVVFGSLVAYSRVFVPHTLTAGAYSIPDEEEGTPGFWAEVRRNLHRIGEQQVLARIQIATIDLSPDDIAALDAGDIVLIENHQLQGTGEGMQGQADIHIGRGKNGVIHTQLLWRNGRADLQIAEIALQQEPQDMADEEDALIEDGGDSPAISEDNLQQTEGILRDVPAPVVVELGRLRMSTSQVIRLKAGQILRLGRGPSDPVDLVVNNRIFARGELIEVDGEIGVRLVQLAK